jgi:Chitobiase/beta-hexosaminidase C-terminal domain
MPVAFEAGISAVDLGCVAKSACSYSVSVCSSPSPGPKLPLPGSTFTWTRGSSPSTFRSPRLRLPMFSPAGGAYSAPLTVTISPEESGGDRAAKAGATIRYTLDGSTPTETNGTVDTSVSISINTLKAIAYKSGMTRIRHGTARGNRAGDGEEVRGAPRESGSRGKCSRMCGPISIVR